MAARGYHGTSIRDIARETGRSLAGLYHYFRGKEDLLFLINYHGFSTLDTLARRIEDDFSDPAARLYAFVYAHTRYFVDNIDAMRVMMWGTQELTPEKAGVIRDLKHHYTERAQMFVSDMLGGPSGQETPTGRRPHVRATEGVAAALERKTYLLFGMMNWVYSWYETDHHGDVDDLAEDIFRLFVGGARVGAGGEGIAEIGRMHAAARQWYKKNRTAPLGVVSQAEPEGLR